MKTQDIVTAALKLEEDGCAYYRSLAAKAPNKLARKTFESFAKDEENHIAWIKAISKGQGNKATQAAVNAIYATLKSIFAGASESEALKAGKDDASLINVAIGKEEASIKVYQEWADKAEAKDVRDLFTILVKAEKTHRQLLTNARTYLEDTGDWFMGEEQWSFDGA